MHTALSRPTSALVVSAELSLAAEFPAEASPRTVLTAIGTGERTFTAIQRASEVPAASLARALDLLARRQVIAAKRPLSTTASKETRYRIDDPYLRFWLYFLEARVSEVDQERGDRVLARIKQSWTSWRGRAVEPVVRKALRRLPPETAANAGAVEAYRTRNHDVEVDLVGADRSPVARRVHYVGSLTWHDNRPFDNHDLSELIVSRERVPGAEPATPLVAVTRTGVTVTEIDVTYKPEDLIAAWRR